MFANKEVILSAGVIATPQLLLLSGIGPKEHISAFAIPSIVNNPYVGKGLTDHLSYIVIFDAGSLVTLDPLFSDSAQLQAALEQWIATKGGPLGSPIANQLGFFRLPLNRGLS